LPVRLEGVRPANHRLRVRVRGVDDEGFLDVVEAR